MVPLVFHELSDQLTILDGQQPARTFLIISSNGHP